MQNIYFLRTVNLINQTAMDGEYEANYQCKLCKFEYKTYNREPHQKAKCIICYDENESYREVSEQNKCKKRNSYL